MDQSLIWSGINYGAILSLYNEDKREAVTEREKLGKPNLPISSCMSANQTYRFLPVLQLTKLTDFFLYVS